MIPEIDILALCQIARDAGKEILSVYDSDFDFETKGDGSPLTLADQQAHQLIESRLRELTPDIPVLSKNPLNKLEINASTGHTTGWLIRWMAPKEFIKRNGEFTVSIALIDNGRSLMGVVFAPVRNELYYAAAGQGAFKQSGEQPVRPIRCQPLDLSSVTIVASRSHISDEVKQFVASVEQSAKQVELLSMGSSLKLCLVADGQADFYPRLGLTSEWDTAAAQCIVETSGGRVVDCEGAPLRYSKADILNPWFMVIADPTVEVDCKGIRV